MLALDLAPVFELLAKTRLYAKLCNGGATHTATELESCPCQNVQYRQLANNE